MSMSLHTMGRVWLLAVLFAAATTAHAEHDVGNPGDPVRLLVAQARDDAQVMLVRVKPADLATADQTLKDWYTAHRDAMQSALQHATLVWIDNAWEHCAEA